MAARKNPETKILVLGGGLAVLAATGAYYFFGQSSSAAALEDDALLPPAESKGKKDPISLVKAHLVAKGKNPAQYQFKAQPKGQDTMVMAKSKGGKIYKFGVRGSKVKLMSDGSDAPAADLAGIFQPS